MNVLSLFDGISCGQLALQRVGVKVDNYFASEIKETSIKVTQHNFPNTIQLGDVTKLSYKNGVLYSENGNYNVGKIDLLIGGSPCQGFSIAGKKLNFEDERSKLFFDFVRIKNELNPEWFLFENVKMKDEIADEIDKILGVERVFINSKDFTGLIRKRYYWTNISLDKLPENDIKIKDIIDHDVEFDKDINFFLSRTKYKPTISRDGIITINPRDNKGKQTWQRGRVYDINGNCPTICATLFDLNITKDHKTYRKLTINECEKLQGVPIGYTSCICKSDAGETLGDGWTVDVIAFIFKNIIS